MEMGRAERLAILAREITFGTRVPSIYLTIVKTGEPFSPGFETILFFELGRPLREC